LGKGEEKWTQIKDKRKIGVDGTGLETPQEDGN
jgi:hypothetical protein